MPDPRGTDLFFVQPSGTRKTRGTCLECFSFGVQRLFRRFGFRKARNKSGGKAPHSKEETWELNDDSYASMPDPRRNSVIFVQPRGHRKTRDINWQPISFFKSPEEEIDET
jgi:hypothetical protein